MLFGLGPGRQGEYFRHSTDLLSYSQSIARYHEIRENNFAFESAYDGPDYLRVQLEKARDFSSLRDANQLLQSEGFYASFFFHWVIRGDGMPSLETVRARHDRVLETMAAMFRREELPQDQPFLIDFVEAYRRVHAEEAAEIVDALLDLSRGVFVDPEAATLWREHYLAALRLDAAALNMKGIAAARERWKTAVAADPKVLYSRLGPQIRCEVPSQRVRIAALGADKPLSFDVNTVQRGVLRLMPGLTEAGIAQWIAGRPYASADDFRERSSLEDKALQALQF